MLLVLLVRGLTLPGAGAGIKFYLYPDISRLGDPQVLQGVWGSPESGFLGYVYRCHQVASPWYFSTGNFGHHRALGFAVVCLFAHRGPLRRPIIAPASGIQPGKGEELFLSAWLCPSQGWGAEESPLGLLLPASLA